jgi:hypothetical protein
VDDTIISVCIGLGPKRPIILPGRQELNSRVIWSN